ncbi:MAG: hypothetical protein NTY35_16770 [Planctomycetota bacterium]|nr:hypothetical protein [Planctomycetota bacterium]
MLDRLSIATRRVIAAADAHNRQFGRPMGFSALERLARAEPGASLGAALVVTHGRAPSADGWCARLDDPEAVIMLHDADMAWAIAGREDVRARIVNLAGQRLDTAGVREHAERLSA